MQNLKPYVDPSEEGDAEKQQQTVEDAAMQAIAAVSVPWCEDAALERVQAELKGLTKASKQTVLDQVLALK